MSRRPIPDFPGYEITEDGRVWSEPRSTGWNKVGQFIKPNNTWKYPRVGLYKNKKQYWRGIHRLVLETFVGSCPKGMVCCHNDGNYLNNRLTNLRWDTQSENLKDVYRHGVRCQINEKHNNAKVNNLQVRIIKQLLKFPREFTQKEIGRIFNVSRGCISNIVQNRNWKEI